MTALALAPTTLAGQLWPRRRGRGALRASVLVLGGTALLAAAAHVQVPFWPVKLSLQTLALLVVAMSYGSRLGGATMLAYLAEGAAGLPVFQGGAGLAYMAGPTGGYLAGYLAGAVVLGALVERGALRTLPGALGAMVLAIVLIYAPGVAWLAVLFGAAKSVAYGLTPFVPGETLKLALALALSPLLRTRA